MRKEQICLAAALSAIMALAGGVHLSGQTSKVQMNWVGLGPALSPYYPCLPDSQTVAPGDVMTIAFDARRSGPGRPVTGSVAIGGGAPNVQLVGPAPATVIFESGQPSNPGQFRIRVKGSVLDILQGNPTAEPLTAYVQLVASDDDGVANPYYGINKETTCAIRIERHQFSVAEPTMEPGVNQYVAKAVITNERNAVLKVPWRIIAYRRVRLRVRSSVLGSGSADIDPRGSVTVTAAVNSAMAEKYTSVRIEADPGNTLSEHDDRRDDNRASTRQVIPIVTRDLDPKLAAAAGATMKNTMPTAYSCARLGVGDWMDLTWERFSNTPNMTGVVFQAECGIPLPIGGTVTAEAYKGFTLKNGWTIAEISETDSPVGSQGVFRWERRPVVGETNPYMRVHMSVAPNENVWRGVRVAITGPVNKDPYQ